MLSVLQVLPALQSGGVERGTLEVGSALAKRGHRSLVVSAGGRLVDPLLVQGSWHIQLPVGRKHPLVFLHIPALRELILTNKIDIVHARSRLPAWLAWLACKSIPAKHRPVFITTVHGQYSVNRYSRIMTQGDRVIAISEYMLNYILVNYPGIDASRISVIPRGVSPEQFPYGYQPAPDWKQEWVLQYPQLRDKFLVTLPGRISRRKGLDDFLSILAILKPAIPAVHGLIVGEAVPGKQAYAEELQKRALSLGLENHLSFLGHRNDIREILSVSAVVLSLSKTPEAFGRSVLEPLAMGVPVVAYNHGGASEIMTQLFPQGLVKTDGIREVAQRIVDFRAARPVIADCNPYTLERMLDETIRLYEQARSEKKRAVT